MSPSPKSGPSLPRSDGVEPFREGVPYPAKRQSIPHSAGARSNSTPALGIEPATRPGTGFDSQHGTRTGGPNMGTEPASCEQGKNRRTRLRMSGHLPVASASRLRRGVRSLAQAQNARPSHVVRLGVGRVAISWIWVGLDGWLFHDADGVAGGFAGISTRTPRLRAVRLQIPRRIQRSLYTRPVYERCQSGRQKGDSGRWDSNPRRARGSASGLSGRCSTGTVSDGEREKRRGASLPFRPQNTRERVDPAAKLSKPTILTN
jgi:hypothetical protein